MRVGVAAIIIGLIVAGTPALAKDSHKPAATAAARGAVHKVAAHKVAAHRPVAKKTRVAALPAAAAPIAEQTGSVRHRKAAKATEKHKKRAAADELTTPEGDPLSTTMNFSADAVGWRLIEDAATGARLGLPEKLVPHAATSRTGSRWTSAQGQIQVETFRLTEGALPALFEEEKKASRRHLASSVLKPDSFTIVGVQGLKNFIIRAEARGSELRGITILYDQATEGIMDRVAFAMASAFAGFPDPNEAALPGLRRRVEYGSAIVVSADGDLIAPAHVTDECETITVPGFGHAERVAADPANDLALIRLYGARNLVPAMLGKTEGGGEPGGELMLVGVADPLAQAGAGEATSVAAHVTAQGIEPAPKPGFSGAAALDARGALAGMADLKPAVIAGTGAVSQAATLVPVAAVRAFLQEHGVTPAAAAADPAAMEQSVARVICVRE